MQGPPRPEDTTPKVYVTSDPSNPNPQWVEHKPGVLELHPDFERWKYEWAAQIADDQRRTDAFLKWKAAQEVAQKVAQESGMDLSQPNINNTQAGADNMENEPKKLTARERRERNKKSKDILDIIRRGPYKTHWKEDRDAKYYGDADDFRSLEALIASGLPGAPWLGTTSQESYERTPDRTASGAKNPLDISQSDNTGTFREKYNQLLEYVGIVPEGPLKDAKKNIVTETGEAAAPIAKRRGEKVRINVGNDSSYTVDDPYVEIITEGAAPTSAPPIAPASTRNVALSMQAKQFLDRQRAETALDHQSQSASPVDKGITKGFDWSRLFQVLAGMPRASMQNPYGGGNAFTDFAISAQDVAAARSAAADTEAERQSKELIAGAKKTVKPSAEITKLYSQVGAAKKGINTINQIKEIFSDNLAGAGALGQSVAALNNIANLFNLPIPADLKESMGSTERVKKLAAHLKSEILKARVFGREANKQEIKILEKIVPETGFFQSRNEVLNAFVPLIEMFSRNAREAQGMLSTLYGLPAYSEVVKPRGPGFYRD